MVVAVNQKRESLHLRVVPELKRQIEAYARETGVPISAGAVFLLKAGLRAERTTAWMGAQSEGSK